jgi:hypothetical protein
VQPHNREKHFLRSEPFCDEQGQVLQLELQAEAVKISSAVAQRQQRAFAGGRSRREFFTAFQLSQRCQRLDWRVLKEAMSRHMGWK